jgi:hypothetical protein
VALARRRTAAATTPTTVAEEGQTRPVYSGSPAR